jgi:hypothetical protein
MRNRTFTSRRRRVISPIVAYDRKRVRRMRERIKDKIVLFLSNSLLSEKSFCASKERAPQDPNSFRFDIINL